jgi:hypothetical protein
MIAIGDMERKVNAVVHWHRSRRMRLGDWDLKLSCGRAKGEYGKLEGGKSYVSFLLHRSGVEEAWTRETTDNIIIMDTLPWSESRELVRVRQPLRTQQFDQLPSSTVRLPRW